MAYDIIIGRTIKDKEKFGTAGTIFLGRHYVQMGELVSLSNKVLMDVAHPHVVLVTGKRGCLIDETKLFTNHGYKKIKDFDSSRDKIYSYNGKNFEWEKAQLLRYELNKEETLIQVENFDGQFLTMTKEHPLLVLENGNKTWKSAKDLEVGDVLIAASHLPEVKNGKEIPRFPR